MPGMCKADTTEDCPDIELNGQSLEIVERLCYLGDTTGARKGAFSSIIARSGWLS